MVASQNDVKLFSKFLKMQINKQEKNANKFYDKKSMHEKINLKLAVHIIISFIFPSKSIQKR